MPSNWLYIDTGFPAFTGQESADAKIDTIQNYLFLLVEQLRYSLRNLDLRNMNQNAVREYEDTLTTPIYARIEDTEGNVNTLKVTAEGLAGRIQDAEGNITTLTATANGLSTRISSAEGNITTLTATANGLATRISSAEGNITTLTATANGLATRISTAEGSITTLTATAEGLSTSVSNMSGDVSSIRQTVDSITLGVSNEETSASITLSIAGRVEQTAIITFTGNVVFKSELSEGTTEISGDCITTGTIDAEQIRLRDKMTVYEKAGKSYWESGYLGYFQSADYQNKTTVGMAMTDISGDKQVVVTTGGARLTSINDDGSKAEIVAAVNATIRTNRTIDLYSQDFNSDQELNVTSDLRQKEDVRYNIEEKYLPVFDLLRPCSFLRRGKGTQRHLGFIAQEYMQAQRDVGISEADSVIFADNNGTYGLTYSEFIPILVAKIQELDKKVKELTV